MVDGSRLETCLVGLSDGQVDVSNRMLISRLQISFAERENIGDLPTQARSLSI
jgi:hypothetical protein